MRQSFYRYSRLLMVVIFIVLSFAGLAQEDTLVQTADTARQKNLLSVGFGAHYGFIFAHSAAVENTKGSHPAGAEVILSWQRSDAAVWNLCNCFPRKGLLLAYYDYNNVILGKSITAAYFLEPLYRLSQNLSFSFKGIAGLSYLTNPYDSIYNPSNRSYSTTINGYLLLGVGLWFRLNKYWWLNTTVNYQHISNGGLLQPNKGINYPTAGLSFHRHKNPRPYYTGLRSKEAYWKVFSPRWDAGVFGIAKRSLDENGNSRRLPLVGALVQGSKQVGRISALTLGAEAFNDQSLRKNLDRDSIRASSVRAGVLLGHEFLLGRFIFSQRFGVYVFNQTSYYDAVYHRWGMHYRMHQHWGIGFNLMAHRHVADFIDLRLVYSWQRKK